MSAEHKRGDVHRDQHGNVIEDYHVCGCQPAAQPSADVVGAALAEAVAHIRRLSADVPSWKPSYYGADTWLRELPERFSAAREAGPPAAAEGWSAGGDFGVGIPGSKGYVPPRAAGEPADEGLRLLRAVRDADVIFAKGDWPLSQEINAYLAAHPEPEAE